MHSEGAKRKRAASPTAGSRYTRRRGSEGGDAPVDRGAVVKELVNEGEHDQRAWKLVVASQVARAVSSLVLDVVLGSTRSPRVAGKHDAERLGRGGRSSTNAAAGVATS